MRIDIGGLHVTPDGICSERGTGLPAELKNPVTVNKNRGLLVASKGTSLRITSPKELPPFTFPYEWGGKPLMIQIFNEGYFISSGIYFIDSTLSPPSASNVVLSDIENDLIKLEILKTRIDYVVGIDFDGEELYTDGKILWEATLGRNLEKELPEEVYKDYLSKADRALVANYAAYVQIGPDMYVINYSDGIKTDVYRGFFRREKHIIKGGIYHIPEYHLEKLIRGDLL